MNSKEVTVPDYRDVVKDLDRLGQKLVDLIHELLAIEGIRVHNVLFRVKDEESADRKIRLNTDGTAPAVVDS